MDLSQIFPMRRSEFKISIAVESYDGKTDEITTFGKAHSF